MNATTLTPATLATFSLYADDSANWSGCPWVSAGNVKCTLAMRGNLSDLVKKDLIEMTDNEGRGRADDMYLTFTEAGESLAERLGFSIY